MQKEALKKILPHREPMLLLDSAECVDGVAFGKKKITGEEWFLKGHFPNNPVVPGVVLCEIMAQSVCVCMEQVLGADKLPFFTGLDKVRFKNPVLPGDLFETKCEIVRTMEPFYFAKGKGYVNGKLCVSAEFSFAITDKKTEA